MEENTEPKPIEMTITLNPNGSVKVVCPELHDKIFCYGLLEAAKFAIVAHSQIENIIRPRVSFMNYLRRKKG